STVLSNDRKSLLQGVSVFRRSAQNDWKVRLQEFSEDCAGLLYELMSSRLCNVIGVGWGATVASAVTGLIALNRPTRSVPAWFIPTCGEPMGEERLDVSSSALARNLDETINGGYEHHLSLAGVPAVIPYDIQSESLVQEVLDRIVRRGRQYREIFVELSELF